MNQSPMVLVIRAHEENDTPFTGAKIKPFESFAPFAKRNRLMSQAEGTSVAANPIGWGRTVNPTFPNRPRPHGTPSTVRFESRFMNGIHDDAWDARDTLLQTLTQ